MFDVFLSHRTSDKLLVEAIAQKLRSRGINPFLDKWHLVPGEPWQEALEKALDESRTCAVFFGPSGLGAWENEELRSALETRVEQPGFRVIPVLLPGAKGTSAFPRFLRRLTWVDLRQGVDDSASFERLLAGIKGAFPCPDSNAQTARLRRGVIHALPPAPEFVGRETEIASLHTFWEDGIQRIMALTGLGGAGKTAIAAEFVNSLLDTPATSNLANLFVWSFYVDIDVDNLLRTAYHHFSGTGTEHAAGPGLLFRLTDALLSCDKTLIVFDGLERIQKPFSDHRGIFGQVDDPLLRQLISKLAFGVGSVKCLITSRFPISDLRAWRDKHFCALPIDQLAHADALNLLRRSGVRGSDESLHRLLDEYGSHALTLDHLSTYIAEFCGGEPDAASHIPEPFVNSHVPEERRLARVLSAYETALDERELDVMKRLAVFRLGTSAETLLGVFSRADAHEEIAGALKGVSEDEMRRILARLVNLHLVLREDHTTYTTHPAVRDHFYRLYTDAVAAHRLISNALRSQLGFHVSDSLAELSTNLAKDLFQWASAWPEKERSRRAQLRQLPNPDFTRGFDSDKIFELGQKYAQHLGNFLKENATDLPPELIDRIYTVIDKISDLVKHGADETTRIHAQLVVSHKSLDVNEVNMHGVETRTQRSPCRRSFTSLISRPSSARNCSEV